MYKKKIKLTHETVSEFVRAANKCDFDIDLGYDRIIVDAKSILGVFSLDLSHKLTVAYPEVDDDFEDILNRYLVA
ncbi:MAG: HPr family phosphocarrier protein [Lachnospiraceae bacterium]